MKYIDTHSHIHFPHYDTDRDDVLARMRASGVSTIVVGTGLETSAGAIALLQRNPDVIVGATIGLHPNEASEGFESREYEKLLGDYVVGIGECGLDYFRTPREEVFEKQREVFEKQIQFALTHDLPLMLHVRASAGNIDAHDDALGLLEEYIGEYGEKVRGTSHFFTAPLAVARRYWDLGFCTSFPGVITFAPETHEVIKEAPQGLILAETDAPYAAPVPFRGKRAEPVHVIQVVETIAAVREEAVEAVAEYTGANAARVFARIASER